MWCMPSPFFARNLAMGLSSLIGSSSSILVVDIPGWEDVSDANEITAAVRGMSASTTNKVLIMINGHRMNDLNLGRYNLDQFLGVDVIDHVEFIKGPGSVLYGNGALIGVINIITRKGKDVDGAYVNQRTTFDGNGMNSFRIS